QSSLPHISLGTTDAGAGIPFGYGDISVVEAAEAIRDVIVVCGIIRRRGVGTVDAGEFGTAGSGKVTGRVHDACPARRRNTGTAEYEPAAAIDRIVVIDPDSGVGVGIGGDIGHKAMGRFRQGTLVGRAGFVGAQAPTAILPRSFADEVAECAATIDPARGGASDGNDVGGNAGPLGPRRIAGRSKVDDH